MTAPPSDLRAVPADIEVNRWMSRSGSKMTWSPPSEDADVPPWSWLVAGPGNEAPQ